MSKLLVEKALTLAIPSAMTRDMNKSDLSKLTASYQIIEIAQSDFLAQRITFEEYIDLCNSHQVNVDSYMESIECNLIQFNLM